MNNYNTVYVGMDVHKDNFTLCCFRIEDEEARYIQKINADYKLVLKYLERMRSIFGEDSHFVCGYEAGCLGYTLYHQLTNHNVECIILAPTTMLVENGKKRIKTDKKDAAKIAKSLAFRTYSPVHIPTDKDEQVKEYIRMREDHKVALKKVKQQILSFCLRHGLTYDDTKTNWTNAHIQWLNNLKLDELYGEVLSEYILTLHQLMDKIKRYDQRIEELAAQVDYQENVHKLTCFIGVKTTTALSIIVEVGDFKRFQKAEKFASYIGLVPGEDSSGNDQQHLGITKAGNTHVRKLLIEAAQCYNRGRVGYKSKSIKERQKGNPPEIISYADKANERLRRRYFKLVIGREKKANIAKTAIARELACFIWGMMTNHIA
jgi:transposase